MQTYQLLWIGQAVNHNVEVDITRRSRTIIHLDAERDGIVYRLKLILAVGVCSCGNITKRYAI